MGGACNQISVLMLAAFILFTSFLFYFGSHVLWFVLVPFIISSSVIGCPSLITFTSGLVISITWCMHLLGGPSTVTTMCLRAFFS